MDREAMNKKYQELCMLLGDVTLKRERLEAQERALRTEIAKINEEAAKHDMEEAKKAMEAGKSELKAVAKS